MITARLSSERGHANHGWLDTYHTFSFADYYDPRFMGFRSLRVINEDYVAPGRGFGTHPHRDMEIITYVLEGALQHKDSMGTSSIIRPGEVQRMTAGTGVAHSEANPSQSKPVHLLQIWIEPEKRNLTPGYEQRAYSEGERQGKLRLVASNDGRGDSVTVRQDMELYDVLLATGDEVAHQLKAGRSAWVQVIKGAITLNEKTALKGGDGAAISEEEVIKIRASESAEVLLFDLA